MTESEARGLTYTSKDGWVCYKDHKSPNIISACDIKATHSLDEACTIIDILLRRLANYEAIGTVEELQALKENERKCEDCAGCTNWLCDCSNERAKAIDEFVKEIEAEYDNDGCPNVSDYLDYKISIRDLQKIAEYLKGGVTDERTGSD